MFIFKKNGIKYYLILILFFLMCVSGSTVFANGQLDAGKIINGMREQRAIINEQGDVRIKVAEQENSPPQDSQGAKIKINGIHITGQNIYSEDALRFLIQDELGKELTLFEMEGLADRIATYFHKKGYVVAGGYIPMQEIKDGILEIRVIIGQYGNISLRNHSKLSDATALKLLTNIKVGDYVKNDVLERTLLLVNDVGDISSKGTLIPGEKHGMTELSVELSDDVTRAGQVSIDNYGNRFTGQNRVNVTQKITGLPNGDVASIGVTTAGVGFNDMNLAYTFLAGSHGEKMGVGYYQMRYQLGKEFASLNATGEAKITSMYGTYPIIRSRDTNLYIRIGYEHKIFQDIHASQSVILRDNQENVWNVGISGDNRDRLAGGGMNSFELNMYSGQINTNDITTSIPGHYAKTVLNYTRWQYINNRLNLLLTFTGQLANKNLDSTEKIFIGGVNGIKAYSQGEGYGDQGYLMTSELRWNMPTPTYQVAFSFERGSVRNKKNSLDNKALTLSGVGIGLIYNDAKKYSLRLDYARKINQSISSLDQDKKGRFWLQGIKYF